MAESSTATDKPQVPRGPRDSKYFNLDDKITIITEGGKNPKKPSSKSYKRFDLYKNGMTIREALSQGVYTADIIYDVQHKFIKLEHVRAVKAQIPEPKPRPKKEKKDEKKEKEPKK
jgi:hypothetical protein